MQQVMKLLLAVVLSVVLVLCFTTKTAFAQQEERFEEELQILADQLMISSSMDHPSFDNHCEMVLADMESYNFDIEADEALLEYVSTLSDAEAMALSKSVAKFRRAFRRIGRFVRKAGGVLKKVAKIAVPIALTAFTGGLGGVSLAGSLGSFGAGLAKGAAFLSKAGSLVGKGQAILGGLNAVTGGKSKLLNKGLGFLNKVSGVIGKGQMFLGRGTDIISGLKGLSSNVSGLKGLASQFKPSELFKGANVFQKGQNFLSKASGLVGKGQDIFKNLNTITGGKNKFINKGLNFLDKAQSFTGIGGDALKGIQGGVNSLKNLKNLRGQDLKSLMTSQNLGKFLGKADNAISKTQDFVSRINDVTGGKSKKLNKLLGFLDKGKIAVGAGNDALNGYNGLKGSLKNLKNLRGQDLKKLLSLDNIETGIGKAQGFLSNSNEFLGKINQLNGGKSKKLNKLIEKLGKGQQALNRGGEIVSGVKGVRQTIKNMDPKLFKNFFLKNNKGNVAVNPEGIKHFLGKMQNVLGTSNDIFQNLNKVTGGKNKFINKALSVIQKGQNGISKGQQGVEKVEQIMNTENPVEKAHQIWEAVESIAHTMKEATETPIAVEQPIEQQPEAPVAIEQPTETPVEQPAIEQPQEQPAAIQQPDETPATVEQSTETPAAQPDIEQPAIEQPQEQPAAIQQPDETPATVEQPVENTPVIEPSTAAG